MNHAFRTKSLFVAHVDGSCIPHVLSLSAARFLCPRTTRSHTAPGSPFTVEDHTPTHSGEQPTTEQNTQSPPAGWHPDPEQPGQMRYWDGAAWTNHRQPAAGPAMPMAQQPFHGQVPVKSKKVWYKRWWAITLAVFVVVMIIGSLTGGGDTPAKDETTTSSSKPAADPAASAKAPAKDAAPAEDTAPGEEAAAAPAKKPAKKFDLAVKAGKMLTDFEDNELTAEFDDGGDLGVEMTDGHLV